MDDAQAQQQQLATSLQLLQGYEKAVSILSDDLAEGAQNNSDAQEITALQAFLNNNGAS